ncbi:hypothetical protein CEXT_654431 [Caerostris extrusa]|uniref:Uncharacterized protein n=1 Tax=Caerostris extrusa TaxID=172846 RepID=A0AAV4RT55_CAEEX|nr:hypothetical protein CEXT_654431 [Caerostris extrusa]
MIDGLLVGSFCLFYVRRMRRHSGHQATEGVLKGKVLPSQDSTLKGDTVISEATKYAHLFYFLRIKLGICVPSGCSLEDINEAAKYVGKKQLP